jgi:alpha-glucosidase (family GH31 glycosyl hydrolase)
MSVIPSLRPGRSRRVLIGGAAALLTLGLTSALGAPTAAAAGGPTLSTSAAGVRLEVPATNGAPGYRLVIDRAPFRITTIRQGQTVLATTPGSAPTSGPAAFHTTDGWASTTRVTAVQWQGGVLDLTVGTTVAGEVVDYRITPQADRYVVAWSVSGSAAVDQVATYYDVASAGHWYGQGEAQTPSGGPYTDQPWPLDSGKVADDAMGPAEYLMTDPFWFTERGSGLWVDTQNVMNVSMNAAQAGVFGVGVTDSAAMRSTVFVERTARDVYADYIGIAGTPAKSDATPAEYAKPLWNTWGQMYTTVSQDSVLAYARGLHDAGVPGHTIQVDDGWMTHYGDFTFNSKFPDPNAMSDAIHAMGYNFGLWITLWINTDADNFSYAAQHGYLLKSKTDPSQPCKVQWWNGTAGIVDLANPAAKAWYEGKLRELEQTYGVDGFKFDTRFFDESCQPYPGYTALDYIKLGAQLTDEFDQQGAGVRISWTGSQKYGFVIREVDKGTDWGSLQAGVAQDMAISTIGYPFVETDMIGGSLGSPPPTKDVLIRWAQAASLMPLMYSSTSPLGVSNPYGSQAYDPQTATLYTNAVRQHEQLASYIEEQVDRAVATGEPIMKPLFFDFPKDRAAYTLSDEWLLGDSLLAAPILTAGTSRSVHLPAGEWYDAIHHRILRGGTITDFHASLGQTPMFVRLGTADTAALEAAVRN